MSIHNAKSKPHSVLGLGIIFDYVGQTSLENDYTLFWSCDGSIRSEGYTFPKALVKSTAWSYVIG
jgi:hypothetical protein